MMKKGKNKAFSVIEIITASVVFAFALTLIMECMHQLAKFGSADNRAFELRADADNCATNIDYIDRSLVRGNPTASGNDDRIINRIFEPVNADTYGFDRKYKEQFLIGTSGRPSQNVQCVDRSGNIVMGSLKLRVINIEGHPAIRPKSQSAPTAKSQMSTNVPKLSFFVYQFSPPN
ncbi:MAG: hypothetical protein LBR91_00025 [Puniceicoccales bacterium]|jgi:hypothetical protein|nr:hypothetical protein [Puniceicoccales bacterium]